MREILTIIAACLVAVLTAALAAPPFVDWNAQRARIEARLSDELGGVARIEGPLSVRLLPAPRISFGALAVERPGLRLRSDAAVFELSPTALLRGRFDFTEAALDRAAVVLSPAQFAVDAAQGARIGVARLRLTDASLIAEGMPGLDHVEMTATADSLLGPFRGTGTVRGSRAKTFTFSTGPAAGGRMLGKVALDDALAHDRVEIDGELAFSGGALAFAGNAALAGAGGGDAPPWRATMALKASPEGAQADNVEARLGDAEHALTASGEARISRDGSLDVKLMGRNLDLDRFRQAWPGWTPLASLAQAVGAPAANIALSADSATLGGDTIAAPALRLRLAAGEAPVVALDADLPGRAHMHYAGRIAADGALDGEARMASRDPQALGAWLAPFLSNAARLLNAAPFARIDVAGALVTHDGGFDARVREAQLDRSTFSGSLAWSPARENARAKLQAEIASPALDIDGLPELGGLSALGGEVDLALRFDARAVRIARVGAAAVDAGHIRFRATRDAAGLALDDIAIENLGGANLTGSALIGARENRADLKLDAQRLVDLATLLRRVAPGAATEAFAARAPALSPARLSAALRMVDGRAEQMSATGEAGGTKFSAEMKPAGNAGETVFDGRAEAGDAAVLLRQAGFAALPLQGSGAATLDLKGRGASDGAIRTDARFSAAGAHVDFSGDVSPAPDRPRASGDVSFETLDATPLIQIFGFGAGDITQRIPAQGKARATIAPDQATLEILDAAIAGARIGGRLSRAADGGLSGALDFDRLSAPFLASLALGPAQPAPAGAPWSKFRFAPAEFDPPRATLDVSAAQVDLGGALGVDAHARLVTGLRAVTLTGLRMRVGDGVLSGEASLRREGRTAMAKASLVADGVTLAAGPFSAHLGGRLALSGAGASAAELVGSLAGEGRARFSQIAIARATPSALADVVSDVEREEGAVAQAAILKSLGERLDASAQRLEPFETELSLANGRLTLAPADSRAGLASVRLAGAFDLRSGQLDLREKLSAPAPRDWDGVPPSIDIVWSGGAQTPARSLQADGLVAALAERAIARETARNAALEADIRERAFFNRRLKSDRRFDAERRAAAEAQRREAARIERERLAREPRPAPVAPDARRAPSAFAPTPGAGAPDPSTVGRY